MENAVQCPRLTHEQAWFLRHLVKIAAALSDPEAIREANAAHVAYLNGFRN